MNQKHSARTKSFIPSPVMLLEIGLFFAHKSPTNQLVLPSLLYTRFWWLTNILRLNNIFIYYIFPISNCLLNILSIVFSPPYHLHVERVCVFWNCWKVFPHTHIHYMSIIVLLFLIVLLLFDQHTPETPHPEFLISTIRILREQRPDWHNTSHT